MEKKIKGIVISDVNYSESSKIINILTKEYGIIGVMAKGARMLKSPLLSVTSKLTYGYFNIYYKENKLSILKEVDIINEFSNIKKDLIKIGYACYLLNLTNEVYKETQSNELFTILESSLIKINNGLDSAIITNIVELKYLKYLGVMPELNRCVLCGNDSEIVTISLDDGGLICKSCYSNQFIVDEKTIKLFKMFSLVDINKIKELNILDKNKLEINNFLETYYDKYTGLYLKSKDFLNQIKNIN